MSRIEQFMTEGSEGPGVGSSNAASDNQLFSEKVQQTQDNPTELLSVLKDITAEATSIRNGGTQASSEPSSPDASSPATDVLGGLLPVDASARQELVRQRGIKSSDEDIERDAEEDRNRVKEASKGKPLTEEDLDKALLSGKIGKYNVLGEVTDRGVRAIQVEDPETGTKAVLGLGEYSTALYYVADIPTLVPAGPGGVPPVIPNAREDPGYIENGYIEPLLRSYEMSEGELIPDNIFQSLDATLRQQMSPNLPSDFRERMLNKVHARIKYHNAAAKAGFQLDEAAGDLAGIYPAEHLAITETPGVREIINQIVDDDFGIYFRLDRAEAAEARQNYIDILSTSPASPPAAAPGGPAMMTQQEAELAVDLAVKTFHIFGESAYYDGIKIRTALGATPYVTPPDHPTPGVPIAMSSDGFISREVLEGLYPGRDRHEQMAAFLEEHWGDILFANEPGRARSLSGQGAGQMRRAIYWPVLLNIDNQQENQGEVAAMRPYAYLWINSAVDFDTTNQRHLPDIRAFSEATPAVWGDHFSRMKGWAPKIAGASKARGVMNEKDSESILNVPLINPNQVTTENAGHEVGKALENYKKAKEAFGHLSFEDRKKAMTHLLKGVLSFVNSQEARTPPRNWLPWGSAILEAAITHVSYSKIITPDQAEDVEHAVEVSVLAASAQIAAPDVGKGLWGGLQKMVGAITKR